MEIHTAEELRFAKIHLFAEQKARDHLVRKGQDPIPEEALESMWLATKEGRRQEYIDKVGRLEAILRTMYKEVCAGEYEEFVRMLYSTLWEKMDAGVLAETMFIPLDMFAEMTWECLAPTTVFGHFDLALDSRPGCGEVTGQEENNPDDSMDLEGDDEEMEDLDYLSSPCGLPMRTNLREQEKPILGKLEAARDKGVKVLERLSRFFENSRLPVGDTNWIDDITETIKLAEPAKVIVGVAGSTGAGKSSIINAIADEENILATNCMRASTAVATEISYNYGDSRYMAKIEFIQPEEWERELEVLFKDLQDSEDDTAHKGTEDKAAALALDKILAVYPSLGEQDILNSSVETLIGDKSVAKLLGTTEEIKENDAKTFSSRLVSYLDSRGSAGKNRESKRRPSLLPSPRSDTFGNMMGLWPLIRVVRIYVKAAALSTGAILVDLPGVFDSSAARVKVAEDYMKQCSAHWIVAPINRAVNDKVALDLLNKTFKRQMQMDCAFNDITFICTKTDDISVSEAERSLDLDLPERDLRDQRKEELKVLEKTLKKLNSDEGKLGRNLDKLDGKIETLESTPGSLGDISENTTPQATPQKAASGMVTPQKRKRPEDYQEEMGLESSPVASKNGKSLPPSVEPTPDNAAKKRLSVYTSKRAELQSQRSSLKDEIKSKERELNCLKAEIAALQTTITHKCIEGRNDYTKRVMKKDFTQGIRELEGTKCPGQDQRRDPHTQDYDELGNELPVFSVSSRAYQKLRGRFRTDAAIDGFSTLEETEIPQLQRHCVFLTEKAREATATRFLEKLNQVLQSIGLWSSVTNQPATHEEATRAQLKASFDVEIAKLAEMVQSRLSGLCNQIDEVENRNIFSRLEQATNLASAISVDTVADWHDSPSNGGFRWNTYRAICNRFGTFKDINWNQELANPMIEHLANSWARVFNTKIPAHLDRFSRDIHKCLKTFHEQLTTPANDSLSTEHRGRLEKLMKSYRRTFSHHVQSVTEKVRIDQKDTNRTFASEISQGMEATYVACSSYRGAKTLQRMRETMATRLTDADNIFRQSGVSVYDKLLRMQVLTRERLQKQIDELMNNVSRDYHTAIIEARVEQISEEQVRIKTTVAEIVEDAEAELNLGELLKPNLGGMMSEAEGQGELDRMVREEGDAMDIEEAGY